MKWKEFSKFMSGFTAASSLISLYLAVTHYTSTFLGYDVTPALVLTKGIVHLALFIFFTYFGFIKKASK